MKKYDETLNKHCTKSTFYAMFETRGITLIVLIVTIVVMLILAGVTIANITGGDSTLDKASEAKDETAIKQEMEEIQSLINNSAAKGIRQGNFSGSADAATIREALKKKNLITENPDEAIIDGKKVWKVTGIKTGQKYVIKSDGSVYKNTSLLPNDFQQVEYIESTGTQYIDTGVCLPYKADFDIYYKNKVSNRVGNVGFGYYNDNNFTFEEQPWNTSNAKNILIFGTNISDGFSFPDGFFNTIRHIELKGNNLYVDGELFATYERIGDKIADKTLLLGAYRQSNGIAYNSGIIMGKMQFLYNNEVLFDGIPCYRELDNVIGMYDTVEGKFCTNQGEGEFTKGEDVY